ncbi:MAG: hypothetical protein MUC87_10440 [Bacteroidia bacterium]|nr:hypothetical protein [Bacteroidia bacterium]
MRRELKEKIKQDSLERAEKIPLEFVHAFYGMYIAYESDSIFSPNDSKKLIEQNCTPELIRKIETAQPDYDPFLNAQDVDLTAFASLSIIKLKTNEYEVSYITTNQERIKIKVILKDTPAGLKISSVGDF